MTTDRAKLEITYDKRYVSGTGCYLITTVNTVYTEPTDLDTCLVVRKASIPNPETFIRIATDTELTTLEDLPATVTHFKSATYQALVPALGDVIHVTVAPALWTDLHSYVIATYTVTNATNPAEVEVTPAFPDYGSSVEFYVTRGSTEIIPSATPATDGEADRDYTGLTGTNFLTSAHYDLVDTNVDVALNFVEARRTEAQSLVDKLNQDTYYTGVLDEVY